jgi:hypothetical protein
MAGRAKVIAASGADNACFPKSHSGSYSYGDKQYEVKAAETAGSFDKCAATVDAALDHKATCGAEQVSAGAACLRWCGSCRGAAGVAWVHMLSVQVFMGASVACACTQEVVQALCAVPVLRSASW